MRERPTSRGLLVAALFATSAWSAAQTTVIRGARIVNPTGETMAEASVSFKDGKIVAVGKIDPGPTDTVIDGKGLTIYPGFIDAYRIGGVKVPDAPTGPTPPPTSNQAYATMWAQNRRGIRAEVDCSTILDLDSTLKDYHAGGITAAMLAAGGPSIRGWTAAVQMNDAKTVLTPRWGMEMSFRSAGGGAGGPGGGGGGGGGYPGSLMGVIALMRQTLIDASAYSGDPKDAVLESLKPAATGLRPVVFFANTENEIWRAMRLQDEFKLKLVIGGGRDAYKLIPQLKQRNIPVLMNLELDAEPSRKEENEGDGPPNAVREERWQLWKERSEGVNKLVAEGVPVAFGSLGSSASDYLANARAYVKRGLTVSQALSAMTSSAAGILGLSDLGAISPGKIANLTILDGDFENDNSKVAIVVSGGKVVDLRKKPVNQ